MDDKGVKSPPTDLKVLGFQKAALIWNVTRDELIQRTLDLDLGVLSDTGALCINTGEFTGRSPKDKFSVKDDVTATVVDWNKINNPISPEKFDLLQQKVTAYLDNREEVYVRDVFACADPKYRLN